MIYVDVYVPSLDRAFDVEADEECTVKELEEEILSLLWKMFGGDGQPDPEGFSLFSRMQEKPLARGRKLLECGVESGNRLILV